MIDCPLPLARVTTALRRSRVVALVGPRPSGKTTLARIVASREGPAARILDARRGPAWRDEVDALRPWCTAEERDRGRPGRPWTTRPKYADRPAVHILKLAVGVKYGRRHTRPVEAALITWAWQEVV